MVCSDWLGLNPVMKDLLMKDHIFLQNGLGKSMQLTNNGGSAIV